MTGPVTNSAVVALDTSILVAHRRRTAEIPSVSEKDRQEITVTVREVPHV